MTDQKTTEDRIDASVSRVLNLRMITGQFDSVADQPYTSIGAEAVNSTQSYQLNLEAALQSLVLLKNTNQVLPLVRGKKTVLLGPHVHSKRDLMSDYKGDQQCVGGDYSCFPSIAEYFTTANPTSTVVEAGVDMNSTNASGIPAALAAVRNSAEQVILFIGIGNAQEHEAHDRFNTSLPGLQEPFTLQMLALCKQLNIPAAVVLINGGAVAIDPVVPAANALVEAFYPSVRGAQALNMALFGDANANRFGRLPVTLYNKKYIEQVDFHNFEMSKPPGRTYKYYTGQPLFEFGQGLSYSRFGLQCSIAAGIASGASNATTVHRITCVVDNLSELDGDEVLMVYHTVSNDIRKQVKHPVPLRALVGFDRLSVGAHSSKEATSFEIGENQLGLVDEHGDLQLIAGVHTVCISNGNTNQHSFNITVKESKVLDVVPRF